MKEIIDMLKDLDNPGNRIYQDGFAMLMLRPWVQMIIGKNPDGRKAMKFTLNERGEKQVAKWDILQNYIFDEDDYDSIKLDEHNRPYIQNNGKMMLTASRPYAYSIAN